VLAEIRALDGARDAVMGLVERLNVSALKLELAHFASLVGWLHPRELHALALDAATKLMHETLTPEVVDIMCEITKHASLRKDFTARQIPDEAYGDAQGLRLIACLAPKDPKVAARVVASMTTPDVPRRQWAAHALTRLQPRDEDLLERLVPYLHDPSPEVATRVSWVLQSSGSQPRSVRRAIEEFEREKPKRDMFEQLTSR